MVVLIKQMCELTSTKTQDLIMPAKCSLKRIQHGETRVNFAGGFVPPQQKTADLSMWFWVLIVLDGVGGTFMMGGGAGEKSFKVSCESTHC